MGVIVSINFSEPIATELHLSTPMVEFPDFLNT
jgi:hypothetical protein